MCIRDRRHIVASDGEGVMDYEYVALDWLISIGEIKRKDLNENQEVFYNVYLGNLDYIKKLKKTQLKKMCIRDSHINHSI